MALQALSDPGNIPSSPHTLVPSSSFMVFSSPLKSPTSASHSGLITPTKPCSNSIAFSDTSSSNLDRPSFRNTTDSFGSPTSAGSGSFNGRGTGDATRGLHRVFSFGRPESESDSELDPDLEAQESNLGSSVSPECSPFIAKNEGMIKHPARGEKRRRVSSLSSLSSPGSLSFQPACPTERDLKTSESPWTLDPWTPTRKPGQSSGSGVVDLITPPRSSPLHDEVDRGQKRTKMAESPREGGFPGLTSALPSLVSGKASLSSNTTRDTSKPQTRGSEHPEPLPSLDVNARLSRPAKPSLAPQESPTTQTQRRKRQRVAWEGILGGMGMGTRNRMASSAMNAEDGPDEVGGGKISGLRSDLPVPGFDLRVMDTQGPNSRRTIGPDASIEGIEEDGDEGAEMDGCPGSPSPAARPRTEDRTVLVSPDAEATLPTGEPDLATKLGDVKIERSPDSRFDSTGLTLQEKIRGFELSGMGRAGRVASGSALGLKRGTLLGGRRGPKAFGSERTSERYQVDTNQSYLSQFTSHLLHGDHRVTPNEAYVPHRSGRDWSAVYACAYSHAAKSGEGAGPGTGLLALGSESGSVKVFDSGLSAREEQETSPATSKYFCPHKNAIFDIKWSSDDSMIMTCSADQTASVHSSDGSRRIAHLKGHTSSVKTGVWYDQNIIATSGRDGNIQIFDLRTRGSTSAAQQAEVGVSRCKRARPTWAQDGELYPVMTIRNAHGQTGKMPSSRSATKSVTSLVALRSRAHTIASGGSADGIIKLWDLRAVHAGGMGGRKQFISESVGEIPDKVMEGPGGEKKRSRGICSLVEGDGMLFSLGYGTSISAHSLASLDMPLPITYTHPNLTTSSFYIKLALSPCSRYLACGSQSGSVFTWEVGQQSRKTLVVNEHGIETLEDQVIGQEIGWNGHVRELGVVDWAQDQIVSCSDDYTNRIWRPNREAASYIKREPENAKWHWAGVKPLA